jgi:hypothetical protein
MGSVIPPESATRADEKMELAERGGTRTRHAESVLVALLQLGREITLDAASSLLHHRWEGQTKLLQFYRLLWEGLDEETQKAWEIRLQPPNHFRGD